MLFFCITQVYAFISTLAYATYSRFAVGKRRVPLAGLYLKRV